MAKYSNNASGGSTDRKRSKNQRIKILIFMVEIIIILVMLLVVWKVFQTTESTEGPNMVEIKESDIVVNPEVKESLERVPTTEGEKEPAMKGYKNIALFGLDAEHGVNLVKKTRSDSIMIASVNMDTGDIKLVSVYRDTYLNKGNDKYGKCNAAYATGGAEQAINMLNMNLDLAITDFVSVSYHAVKECVDGLGGVWIDVDSAELKHINNYQLSIIKETANDKETAIPKSEYIEVKDTGYQLLNGLQATAYCRIRYTKGDDYKRTERQREVLKAMEEQVKQADLKTLEKLATKVLKYVYTSLDEADILELLKNVSKYSIVAEDGFPKEDMRTSDTINGASCVIPLDLEKNVVWLHEFLFDEADYQVSSSVKEYSKKIKSDTDKYINN